MGLNENKEVTMANVKLGTKAVGSIVKIKVNGASKDFIVVQQGNPNTSTYDFELQWNVAADEGHLHHVHVRQQ